MEWNGMMRPDIGQKQEERASERNEIREAFELRLQSECASKKPLPLKDDTLGTAIKMIRDGRGDKGLVIGDDEMRR